jgi:hypothetical protein
MANSRLTSVDSERVVGLGIASDWVRRAASIQSVSFANKQMNRSRRASSFCELVRFNFAWSAANAIFARNHLLTLLGTPARTSELERFKVLVRSAQQPAAIVTAREQELHGILLHPTITRLPSVAKEKTTSTIFAINEKYVPTDARNFGTGRIVAQAANTGDLSKLDLPILLYAFRNWSVHGNSIDGSFGGIAKFEKYVSILIEILADVHQAVSLKLESLA